jgi:CheY-like chemotaxis protein
MWANTLMDEIPEHIRLPVLVVDDDEPTRRLVQAVLRRSGYDTETATNGGEAIALLRKKPYAAIVLDMMMPRIGGRDVIEFLSNSGSTIPVVICSAAGPAALTGLDAAVVKAVIRKPFDVNEFIDSVTSVARGSAQPIRVLVVDDDERARYTLRAFLGPADVIESETGEQALGILREQSMDVVLLDLILPGTPGEEILRQIRETEELRDVPVVVVTSRSLTTEDRAELLRYAVAVVYKGDLSRQALSEAIAQALKPRM